MDNSRAEPGAGGLRDLFGSVIGDFQDLLRGEVKLARAEFSQKLDRLILAAIWLVGGALVAFAGLVVLLEGFAAVLALVMPAWAAAFIVGVVIVIIGAVIARSGLAMLSLESLSPDRTAANLKKDARVVKERT
jgi:hypothetical protein